MGKAIKSSFCNNGDCIEVERAGSFIVISDSECPEVFIEARPEQFKAFIEGVKAGDFDEFLEET